MMLTVDDAACEVPAAFVRPPDARRVTDALPIAVAVEFGFTLPSIVMTSRCAAEEYVLSPPVYHCDQITAKEYRRFTETQTVSSTAHHSRHVV